jgi:hypothetical protein
MKSIEIIYSKASKKFLDKNIISESKVNEDVKNIDFRGDIYK